MNTTRLFERFAEFSQALRRLSEAASLPVDDIVRDALIQRFEFTYELAWKTLKLYLDGQGIEATSPKQVLREALSAGIIHNGNDWSLLHEQRNVTSHTYSETTAQAVYDFVVACGLALLAELEKELKVRLGVAP
ncbi:MAG: nucleotidyltransferase substrate binding protein [Myxococcota bacterium]|jgi:nucleotidyltransferase substrate binding protein (TIGR01987 family)|nr:nucleotidyltransferase substrate binding protein [Myxococcota bacterium]